VRTTGDYVNHMLYSHVCLFDHFYSLGLLTFLGDGELFFMIDLHDKPIRSGMVAIVGPPNAGKSTLMNGLLEQKISIVSPKPQTTRNRILGIMNDEAYQIVLLDYPRSA